MKNICINMLKMIEEKKSMVLVTLVAHQGSTPRGTGSQMLVGESGRIAGTIGGGAVEGRAISLGKELIPKKESLLKDFALDLSGKTDPEETNLGMVCGGGVKAYLAYIDWQDEGWKKAAEDVLECFDMRQKGNVVIHIDNGSVRVVASTDCAGDGATPDGSGPVPRNGLLADDKFILPVPLEERVIIFGGGHVAQALVPVLCGIGFTCTVFENRQEFATKELFPLAHQIVLGDYGNIEASLKLSESDYIVIMTSGHLHDFAIEEQLLRKPFAYIGMMGSHRKIAAVNEKLLAAGISQESIDFVHTPIGLEISAVTPSEIAISVAAELIQVRAES